MADERLPAQAGGGPAAARVNAQRVAGDASGDRSSASRAWENPAIR
jgi:hypothetical protein